MLFSPKQNSLFPDMIFINKKYTSRRIFIPYVGANLLALGLSVGVLHLALDLIGLSEPGALVMPRRLSFGISA